jgi:hypothetical protein
MVLISSQDEDMKKKFEDLLAKENKPMALPQGPAQVTCRSLTD